MIIEYDGSVAEGVKREIKLRIDTVAYLLPVWCDKLTVYWEPHDKDGDTYATCDPLYEYRHVGITLYPLFLESPSWRDILIHEIHHAILKPYISKVDKIVEKLIKDESMTDWLNADLADAEEALCEDLAIFARKLKG